MAEKDTPESEMLKTADTTVEKPVDEDLDSIMKELESLERDTLVDAMQEDADTPISAEAPAKVAEISNAPQRPGKKAKSNSGGSSQSLTLELTGTLNLKLGFVTGGKSVELVCTDEALICRFGDGTEIRIPTENPRSASMRRSA
jgi:hypothetical protein